MTLQRKSEMEGGCGVIGLACAEQVGGKHLLPGLQQMCNRGNGKGGGIAAVGMAPVTFEVSQNILDNDYLLAVAYLDLKCRAELEKEFLNPYFNIDHVYAIPHIKNYKSLKGVDVKPPEVISYFVHLKKEVIDSYKKKIPTEGSNISVEDEIIYQIAYHLNHKFYASTGNKRAFLLSHGKNLLVLKMVGYGDDVIRYYQLEDFLAHVWIGHHRYPTKGKIWHPGGAHPFVGQNEALVHNGDFANYYSICEYLEQRKIYPLFLTDTEVSALLFDLYHRSYKYPLEYVIEVFAPTTELDFTLLSSNKQAIYKALQTTHMHGSPDGPWFFLIAQSVKEQSKPIFRLIGITDTSMLRPQVFALQQGLVPIGLSSSEKQAIDATLKSLAEHDNRFWNVADYYWSARGGSYTDGGAFLFTIQQNPEGKHSLITTNKFGIEVHNLPLNPSYSAVTAKTSTAHQISDFTAEEQYQWILNGIKAWDYEETLGYLDNLKLAAIKNQDLPNVLQLLTKLLDRHYPMEKMRRSSMTSILNQLINDLLDTVRLNKYPGYIYLRAKDPIPKTGQETLVINGTEYPSEGERSLARTIVESYQMGFTKFIVYQCKGQRFLGNGLGPNSAAVQIHVYGSSGDYLGSGIDGAEIHVHGSGQDQLAQIMNRGTLIVHGDIGQTFMYGAKGGRAFILGNTAGRPLINAVGHPRVVINGTCLDYLAESFMAGNAVHGGGFVIVNGITFDPQGNMIDLESPYPGNNLFSLATGGAVYIRDPARKVTAQQLNGSEFVELTSDDWEVILPYLEENALAFEIPLIKLLEHQGKSLRYSEVYRKIRPIPVRALQEEEAWVKCKD